MRQTLSSVIASVLVLCAGCVSLQGEEEQHPIENAGLAQAAGGCVDDSSEDNDTYATAAAVGAGSYIDLAACPSDADWYAIDVTAGEDLSVALSFTHSSGDIDARILDPNLSTVKVALSSTDDESLSYAVTTTGTYLIHIWLDTDDATPGNAYAMTITAESCPTDSFEDNDLYSTPAPATEGSSTGLAVCTDDADWYSVDMTAGEPLSVDLSFTHASGDINARILDPSLSTVTVSLTSTDDESLTHTATTTGTYLIHVWLGSDDATTGNTYSMDVSSGGCTSDAYEDNDVYGNPAGISLGTSTGLVVCTDDEDWYSIDLTAGEELSVDLSFTDSSGDIDARILNPSLSTVSVSLTETDDESLTHTAATTGTYLVHVWLSSDDATPGNTYAMGLASFSCPTDSYEDNDAYSSAAAASEETRSPGAGTMQRTRVRRGTKSLPMPRCSWWNAIHP